MVLEGARNEWLAAQVCGAPGAAVTATPVGPVPAPDILRLDLVQLAQPSDTAGGTGAWPDRLTPAAVTGSSGCAWLDYLVPAAAPPGTYRGSVTVGGTMLPVTVRIRTITLPSTPTFATWFGISDQGVCRAHYSGDPSCGDWGARAMDLLDRYQRFALDHRITLGGGVWYTRPRAAPWDWSAHDVRYTPWLEGTAATRLKGARVTSVQYHLRAVDSASYTAFAAHFRARGWLPRVFDYTADEPGYGTAWSVIPPRAALARAAGLPSQVTTTHARAQSAGVGASIDRYVYNVTQLAPGQPPPRWVYTSCNSHDCAGPSSPGSVPSYVVDHAGHRHRATPWVAFRHGAVGELYWQVVHAYEAGGAAWAFTGNGDGTLLHPAPGLQPGATQRWKLIRAGVQDYEYLAQCRAKNAPLAQRAVEMVVPAIDGRVVDRIAEARALLADCIDPPATPAPTLALPPRSSPVWVVLEALRQAGVSGAAELLRYRP